MALTRTHLYNTHECRCVDKVCTDIFILKTIFSCSREERQIRGADSSPSAKRVFCVISLSLPLTQKCVREYWHNQACQNAEKVIVVEIMAITSARELFCLFDFSFFCDRLMTLDSKFVFSVPSCYPLSTIWIDFFVIFFSRFSRIEKHFFYKFESVEAAKNNGKTRA